MVRMDKLPDTWGSSFWMLDLPICQDVMSPAMICTFEVVNHAISTKLDQDSDFGALEKNKA